MEAEIIGKTGTEPLFQEGSIIANRYEIKKLLGKGGTGAVYHVVDLTLDGESCALKLLPPQHSQDESVLGRFRNEVILARKLGHKNIARTYDFGSAGDGYYYITMEFLPSGNLSDFIKGAQTANLDLRPRLSVLKQIAEGIAYAHENGVIHRDLKPENILLAQGGHIKISDFGLARSLLEDKGFTRAGETVGTPCYMAPEQFRGEKTDARTDIYSFGILAFELLSGSVPFYHLNYKALADLHLLYPLPKLKSKSFPMPASMEHIVRRCAEKKPIDRYQCAHEIVLDLSQHL